MFFFACVFQFKLYLLENGVYAECTVSVREVLFILFSTTTPHFPALYLTMCSFVTLFLFYIFDNPENPYMCSFTYSFLLCVQALGGMVVGLVTKYAGGVVKGFALIAGTKLLLKY